MEQLLETPVVSTDRYPVLKEQAEWHGSKDQRGRSLKALSYDRPVLLVFLRHLGCTFCREAASDIAVHREAIEREGVVPAFVGMADDIAFGKFLESYGIGDLPRFADPDRRLYRAFGLGRGNLRQLFGSGVWRRGLDAATPSWLGGGGHGLGALQGDALQLPGVFLLHEGRLIAGYRHETAADRPDYQELACEVR